MITVAITDDHAIVREGLALLLTGQPDIDLVGEFPDGESAVAAMAGRQPDVMLMDLAMPGIGGVEATRLIAERAPGVAVVVLTTFGDAARVYGALDAGAVGYLMKDSPSHDVIAGVRAAAEGGSPLDPRVARTLLEGRRGAAVGPRDNGSGVGRSGPVRLTDKQSEVLALVAAGLSNRLIAGRLGISEKTVKAHLTQVYLALGVTDRVQAALWAREHQARE
jgi:DNA-binding NarL/FixJ family response regulator